MPDAPLVLCEITGHEVPQDETVMLDGKRVGAEGKLILLERMKSGKNAPIPLAPRAMMRGMAMILDWVIIGIIALTCPFLFFPLGIVGLFAYFTLMHGIFGQTLGKLACGIKVVRAEDLKPIGVMRALARTSLHLGPCYLLALLPVLPALRTDAPGMPNPMQTGLQVLPLVYLFVSSLFALLGGDRQGAVHDHLTQTRVVSIWAMHRLATQTPHARHDKRMRALALELLEADQAHAESAGNPDENSAEHGA